jgi:hypothetical protein
MYYEEKQKCESERRLADKMIDQLEDKVSALLVKQAEMENRIGSY